MHTDVVVVDIKMIYLSLIILRIFKVIIVIKAIEFLTNSEVHLIISVKITDHQC